MLGVALYLLGAALLLGPSAYGWAEQRAATRAAEAALAQGAAAATGTADTQAESDVAPSGGDAGGSAPSARRAKDDPAYAYLRDYNARVVEGTAGPAEDPWDESGDSSPLAGVGLADQVMGTIAIPRLGETLPVYLGATYDNLARGAAVVSGTSVPLGEQGSNSVIAAHRGQWRGLPMFRDIEDVQLSDLVTIETPWDTLVYEAVEFRVIAPTDTDAVRPQPGRDLVTLLTCHPYGHNYQRYLVICERVDAPAAPADSSLAQAFARPALSVLEPSSSPELAAERWLRLVGLVALVLAPVVLAVRTLVRRRR